MAKNYILNFDYAHFHFLFDRKCSVKKDTLKYFANLTGKRVGVSFNKVSGLKSATLLKRDSSTGILM